MTFILTCHLYIHPQFLLSSAISVRLFDECTLPCLLSACLNCASLPHLAFLVDTIAWILICLVLLYFDLPSWNPNFVSTPIWFFLNLHPSIPSLVCARMVSFGSYIQGPLTTLLFLQNFSCFRYIQPFTMTYLTNATVSGTINHFCCSKNLTILWIIKLITFKITKV